MIGLLAIALSVDALGIGISYGVRDIRVPLSAKCIIAAISVIITGLAVGLGSVFVQVLSPFAAKLTGALLLFLMGGWIIYQGLSGRQQRQHPEQQKTSFQWMIQPLGITITIMRDPYAGDLDHSARLDPIEAIYMGIALSVDSIGAGIGSAIAGLGFWLIPVMTGVFQLLFLMVGGMAGHHLRLCKRVDPRLWTVLSGLMLMALAMVRLL